jgi:ankyrin repeat protein
MEEEEDIAYLISKVQSSFVLSAYDTIHRAAQAGDIECMIELLNRGADIKSRNYDNCTALHAAAMAGQTECLLVLLDRGANIESRSSQGFTALHTASSRGQTKCLLALLDRGANIESRGSQGFTALHAASSLGQTVSLIALLDRGANIESSSNVFGSALAIAAFQENLSCIRFLLDRGAVIDVNRVCSRNRVCENMIVNEIQHRLRRAAFDSFIIHHTEYPLLIDNIYSRCYPSGDLRVASPAIGWDRAEAVRNKYYFDEVLFYMCMCM